MSGFNKNRGGKVVLPKHKETLIKSKTYTLNDGRPIDIRHLPAKALGPVAELLEGFYLRAPTVRAIESGAVDATSISRMWILAHEDRALGLPRHPFIDKLIREYHFCVDCYADLLSRERIRSLVSHGSYEEFNEYFGGMRCVDPYTMKEIVKSKSGKSASIEHCLPYSKTLEGLRIDADFQNLYFVDTVVNSLRRDYPLSFKDKDPAATISVVVNGKVERYGGPATEGLDLDAFPTLEKVGSRKVFCPPTGGRGFIARKIVNCMISYLDSNADNFADMYGDLEFDKVLFHLGDRVNVLSGYLFEEEMNAMIMELQGSSNFCLTDPFFVRTRLFGAGRHTH